MARSKKESLPILTRAESELMRALWDGGPATVQELVSRLARPLAYNTVLTTVRVLEQKGYVRHEPPPGGGRAFLYRAAVEPAPVRRRHVRDLIERLFSGDAGGLVTGLLEDEGLSEEELRALRKKIDAQLGKRGGRDG
jgi:predicted transcriptional regulator